MKIFLYFGLTSLVLILVFNAYFIWMCIFLKKDFIYFLERGEGRLKGGERNTGRLVASCTTLTGDLAHSPGMCPDTESNRQSFSLCDDAQPIVPYQSVLQVSL